MSNPDPKNPEPVVAPSGRAENNVRPVLAAARPAPAKGHAPPPINALAILTALRRRWLAGALLGLLAGGAAFAAVWFFLPPPKYTGTTKFLIPSKPEGTLYDHPEAKTEFSTYEDTQVAVIKSQMVLAAALRKPQVAALDDVKKAADPLDWLGKELRVDFPNGKEILRLSISSDDDKACKILLNAVSTAYMDEITNQAKKRRQERLDQLMALNTKFEGELKTLRDALHAAARPVGGGNDTAIALKQLEAHEQAVAARRDLVEVETRLRNLETEAALAKDRGPAVADAPDETLDALIDKRPEVAGLLAQKAQLEAQIELMKPMAVGGENNPSVRKQIVSLEALKKDLESARSGLRAEARKQLQTQTTASAQARAGQRQQEIESARALRGKLLTDIDQLSKEAKEFSDAEIDMDDLKRQILEKEGVAKRCADEFQKLSIEQLDPYRVTPWEEVVVSRPDEMSRKVSMAGMGAGGAFLVAALLVGFIEFRTRRVATLHDVAHEAGLAVVGTLPARPASRRGNRDPVWHALLTESVDSVRTMLLHGGGGGPEAPRVVMVTSAVGGEAKTSLAGHLAVSLARSGRKTLLIDGDLRSPAAHRLFDLREGPGLSEVLRGEALPPDVLLAAAEVAGLEVLPAGKCNPETLSQLSQGIFGVVLGRLKESFDFIIVDSSPVLPVTDSLLLARHADGVLFSVLLNTSTLPAVQEAQSRVASLGVALLGAVVSGVRPDVSSYGRRRYLKSTAANQ